jgi:hypothetical protein
VLILCKLDFGLGFAEEASTWRHHCKFRHTAERRAPAPALRASPCNHSNLDISANSPKLRKPLHPLGAADPGNHTPGSSVHAISACGRNPSA